MAIACKEGGALKADEAEWVQKGTISGLGNVTRSIS